MTSAHWPGHRAHWIAAVPAGTPRATVIVLHGRGDNAATAADGLDLTSHAARTNLALVAIGGENTYWTDDGAGTDTGAMVIEDLLPQLAAQGLPVERVAVTGYSMGGLGALLLTQRWPQRIIAAAPMSAAVWAQPHPGIEGAAQTAVRRDVARLANTPVRIVSGTEDDLTPDNQSLAAVISRVSEGSRACCLAAGVSWLSPLGLSPQSQGRQPRASDEHVCSWGRSRAGAVIVRAVPTGAVANGSMRP